MATIEDLRQVVSETKRDEAAALTQELLEAGLDPMDILEEGVMSGLNDVGNRFAAKKAIVLDLVRAGVCAKACIPVVEEAFPKGEGKRNDKKIVLGTMLSQHNIGKNLVGTLLSIGGFFSLPLVNLGLLMATGEKIPGLDTVFLLDANIRNTYPEHPFIHATDKFAERFGSGSLVAMAVVKKDGDIYDNKLYLHGDSISLEPIEDEDL